MGTLMENLDTFDALVEAERAVMLAEYVKRTDRSKLET